MTEFELKLEIPPQRLAAVLAAVQAGKASGKRLRAHYFDTKDDALARGGVVLRLRKEGRTWMQTAKCAGDSPLARLEHSVSVGALPADALPDLLLQRHADTPAGKKIMHALGVKSLDEAPALLPKFETDVRRLARRVEYGGSMIEIALDRGEVIAEGARSALCEIEFELLEGDPADAVRLAGQWGAAHGLWLSTTSKSAKGLRLAAGQESGPPVTATDPRLGRRAAGGEIAVAVVRACLDQVLGNASDIAAGCGGAEHIHQLRVGIRRLRTAMRELAALAPTIDSCWEPVLVELFRTLGKHRDHGHLGRSVEPQLEAQGGPSTNLGQTAEPPEPAEAVRAAAFQDALLGLLAFTHSAAGKGDTVGAGRARDILAGRLEKLHAQVGKDGRRFQQLEPARQHRVRKRLKRLRYLAEFVAPLFSARKGRDFVSALKPAQEALGLYNDELMALEAYRSLAAHDPAAWFGVGWLTARRGPNAARCQRELEGFAKAKPFWG